jgi:uncharacterized protein (TIGR03790 family)
MAKSYFVFVPACCVVVVAILGASRAKADTPLSEMTVVAYNQAEPISVALAKLYVQQRGIPNDHLVGLDCSIDEDVSRDDFEATIFNPLRDVFKERHWWAIHVDADGKDKVVGSSIRFLAIIRGVPLKIRPSAQSYPGDQPGNGPIASHNEASVDSELSLLAFAHHSISGANSRTRIFYWSAGLTPPHRNWFVG